MKRLAVAALIVLAATGCRQKAAEAPANAAAEVPGNAVAAPAPRMPDAKVRLAAAVRAAFPEGTQLLAMDDDTDATRRFDDHRLIDTREGPVLVSYGAVEMGLEQSPGIIAVTYLRPAGDGFAAARRFPEAVRLGSQGMMTRWDVVDNLAADRVIRAEGGHQAEGYRCDFIVLTAISARGPVEIGSLQSGYDDSGAGKAHSTTLAGRMTDIVPERGFTMRYSGTRSFAERYVWHDGRFMLEGKSRVPEC